MRRKADASYARFACVASNTNTSALCRRGARRADALMSTSLAPTLAPPPPATLVGAELYNALYATGYHSSVNTSRAHEVINYFSNASNPAIHGVHSVLDVGCSHGYAVSKLWELNYTASGVDISSIAVEKARVARGQPDGKCVDPCFAVGPATAIPHSNSSFDAIMSTDVLEHVEKKDVRAAIIEFSRVARKLLILKIATRSDAVSAGQVKGVEALHKNGTVTGTLPGNLHPTVRSPTWWRALFKELGGWRYVHTFPYNHKRPWLCCTIVLRRGEDAGDADGSKKGASRDRLGKSHRQ